MQTEPQQTLTIGGGPHHILHHHPLHHHHLHLSRGGSLTTTREPSRSASPNASTTSAGVAGAGSLCVGCGAAIQDQYILRVAPDLEWHASCLKCVECGVFLDENCTCFVRDGKTFCRRDYVRLFGAKCDKCGLGFSRSDFVMRAKSKIYHIECFRCALCQRQLVPGDEFALRDDGNLFCKDDHDQNGLNNNNNSSSANNNHLHHIAAAAAAAAAAHHGGGGGPPPGLLHHVHHHSSPLLLEAKSELLHHNQSSNSSSGTTPFLPGLGSGSAKSHKSSSGRHSRANSNDSHSDSSDTCITTSTRKDHGERLGGGSGRGHHKSGGGGGSGVGGGGSDGKPTRVRTVLNEKQLHTLRTCYAANPRPDALMKEQLVEMTGLSPRVIRVWFQNKRCKDKKKAILMKQIQQQEKVFPYHHHHVHHQHVDDQDDDDLSMTYYMMPSSAATQHEFQQHHQQDGRKLGFGSMQGIPLIASSPVRHGDASPTGGGSGGTGGGSSGGVGGINPVEVHAFAPPWKALAEFALHNDLERIDPSAPHFQQLINQMHGYDIHGPPELVPHQHLPQPGQHLHHGGFPGQHHGLMPPSSVDQHMAAMSAGGMLHHHHHPPPPGSQHSHDPSDAFVQFLDSDEDNSMHHDGHSP